MKYRWMLGLLALLWTTPVFAQDDPEPAEEYDSTEEDLGEALSDLETPESADDYDEIQQIRVLERTFMPREQSGEQTHTVTVMPGNMMELSHENAMHVLLEGTPESGPKRGLQRQASRWMADSVALVRKQISAAGPSLEMPFGLDCASQPAVQEHIAIFTAGASGTIKTWLKRLGRWRAPLEKALAEENVPRDLIFLAMIESGFKPRVKSPASAAGMWQFMAGTGAEMGLRITPYVDERFDPIKAAHAAAKYLKKQYARYNSWPLAMAAYNGGPGTVNVAIDRYNTTDYFKLVEYGAMYDETRKYVPRILAAGIIGKNPAAFGLDGLKPEPPFVFDVVEVPGETRLSVLAEAAGCSVDTLKELNPELLKDITPPGGNYELRIPLDSHAAFVEKFDKVNKKYKDSGDFMTIRFGETLETLGEEIGTPARVLRALNRMRSKEAAAYGSEILVPKGSKRNAKTPEDLPVALISPEKFTFADRTRVFYQTQKGDKIRDIADAFGVMPNQLSIWNELDAWAKLRPNMMLQIYVTDPNALKDVRFYSEDEVRPVIRGSEEHQAIIDARRNANVKSSKSASKSGKSSKSSSSSGKTSSSGKYIIHTVGKGDSLSKIAKKYGVTVEYLLKLNNLKADSPIHKGQQIKVKKK